MGNLLLFWQRLIRIFSQLSQDFGNFIIENTTLLARNNYLCVDVCVPSQGKNFRSYPLYNCCPVAQIGDILTGHSAACLVSVV
jgi:hypothetical protein